MILNPAKEEKPTLPIPAKPAKQEKHIHTYERSASRKDVYKCIDPDCQHYHNREFLVNKRALCGKCREPFLLTKTQLKNKIPVCLNCTRARVGEHARKFKSVMDLILTEKQEIKRLDWDKE